MACWQVLCYFQGVYSVHHFTILRVSGFVLVGRDENLPRWHHSKIIHHLSILNNEVFKVTATAVKKQVRKYLWHLLVEKNRRQSQKTAEAQPGRRKKTIRLQLFFSCGAWVFFGCTNKKHINSFSVWLEVEIKCNWYVLPVVLWEKLTYSMDVKLKKCSCKD